MYENTTGTKYKKISSKSYELKYPDRKDENGYDLSDDQLIIVIYEYILSAIEYDFEKINGLDYTYLPNIDETFDTGKGICYDYCVLFASMLRSEGIPTRMVNQRNCTFQKDAESFNKVKFF